MGKKRSKTKTVNTPWGPAIPAITGALDTTTNIVNSNQPRLDALASGIAGQLPQLQNMAFGPNPSLNAANGYAQDILGGKYLDANPYMDAMVHQGEQDAGNAVNSTFSRAGRTGGLANQQALARGVAQAGNQIRYGNYAQERQNQQQAASMIPGLTQAQYAGIMPWLAATQQAGQLPYAGVGALSPIIGLASGSGTSRGTQPGGWGTDLLNAAASAASAAAMGSDRRLKKNIEKVGEFKDGLGIYTFTYKNDPTNHVYRGVMADEVKTLRPDAFVSNFDGFGHDGVNYGAL